MGDGGEEGGEGHSCVDSDEDSQDLGGGWERLRASRLTPTASGSAASARRPVGRQSWNGWGECWGLEADDVGVVDHVELAQRVRHYHADEDGKMLQEDQCEMAGMHPWLPLRGVLDASNPSAHAKMIR